MSETTIENFGQTKKNSLIRVVLSCMVGNALEWYDFALYGYFAAIIAQLFFPPSGDSITDLVKSYGIFFVGFIARPLGAILFGYVGDVLGRKKALMWSIYLMAIPTALIGFLPTYQHIGFMAPVLLTILRLFQGLSMGGEFTGTMIFIVEHAPAHKRGFWGSWSSFSVLVGLVFGSGLCAFISAVISPEQMISWGWRIPFIFSLVGSWVGSYMRKSLSDPRHEENSKEKRSPFLVAELFRNHLKALGQVILIDMTVAVGFFMICVFIMTYLQKFVGFSYREASIINTLSMLVFASVIPLAGWMTDVFGKRFVLMIAVGGFLVCSVPCFYGLSSGNGWWAALSQMILAFFMGINFSPIPVVLTQLFPERLRFSGVSIAHNFSMAIFGGTTPNLLTYAIRHFDSLIFPGIFLSLAACISLIGVLQLKKGQHCQ